MFISKELALAMAEGRRKFLSVYEGRAVLLMPFAENARHVSTHYVPELARSIMCEGEETCRYHFIQEVAKVHVASLVLRKALPYASRECSSLPAQVGFDAAGWSAKIVELTEHCFAAFHAGEEYGTLATIARAPVRKNNPVEFRWLHGHQLIDFPATPLSPENIVPAVIRGIYYPTMETRLDKDADGRIKHNSN